jgi:hypothetical protein
MVNVYAGLPRFASSCLPLYAYDDHCIHKHEEDVTSRYMIVLMQQSCNDRVMNSENLASHSSAFCSCFLMARWTLLSGAIWASTAVVLSLLILLVFSFLYGWIQILRLMIRSMCWSERDSLAPIMHMPDSTSTYCYTSRRRRRDASYEQIYSDLMKIPKAYIAAILPPLNFFPF